jgi:hypothetical protein
MSPAELDACGITAVQYDDDGDDFGDDVVYVDRHGNQLSRHDRVMYPAGSTRRID